MPYTWVVGFAVANATPQSAGPAGQGIGRHGWRAGRLGRTLMRPGCGPVFSNWKRCSSFTPAAPGFLLAATSPRRSHAADDAALHCVFAALYEGANLAFIGIGVLVLPIAQAAERVTAELRVIDQHQQPGRAEARHPVAAGFGFLVHQLHRLVDLKVDLRPARRAPSARISSKSLWHGCSFSTALTLENR